MNKNTQATGATRPQRASLIAH